jgi:hypothetical protein
MPALEDATAAIALITDPVAMEFLGGVHPNAASDPKFVVRRWLERWLIEPANLRSQRLAERLGATPGETIELFDNGPHVVWTHPR